MIDTKMWTFFKITQKPKSGQPSVGEDSEKYIFFLQNMVQLISAKRHIIRVLL